MFVYLIEKKDNISVLNKYAIKKVTKNSVILETRNLSDRIRLKIDSSNMFTDRSQAISEYKKTLASEIVHTIKTLNLLRKELSTTEEIEKNGTDL